MHPSTKQDESGTTSASNWGLNDYTVTSTNASGRRVKQYRMTLVGYRGVGKTALCTQFVENKFRNDYPEHKELLFKKKMDLPEMPTYRFMVDILDTQGAIEIRNHEIVMEDRYRKRTNHIMIFVFSITNDKTFKFIEELLRIEYEADSEYFDNTGVIIIGNKCDQVEDREVETPDARELARDYGAAYFETSAKTNTNVDKAFYESIRKYHEKSGELEETMEPSKPLFPAIHGRGCIARNSACVCCWCCGCGFLPIIIVSFMPQVSEIPPIAGIVLLLIWSFLFLVATSVFCYEFILPLMVNKFKQKNEKSNNEKNKNNKNNKNKKNTKKSLGKKKKNKTNSGSGSKITINRKIYNATLVAQHGMPTIDEATMVDIHAINKSKLMADQSHGTDLTLTVTKEASMWKGSAKQIVSNPLVVILGIGEYDGMPNLDGVLKDYKNIIYTFYNIFGYSIIFSDNQNKLHYCNKYNAKLSKSTTEQFKMNWTIDDIEQFIEKVTNTLDNNNTNNNTNNNNNDNNNDNNNNNNNHDGLLLFISCHGESDGIILDSNCEEYQLSAIYYQFYGENSPHLLNKPKIFIVDACRGSMRSIINVDSTNTDKNSISKGNQSSDFEKTRGRTSSNNNGKHENETENKQETNNSTNTINTVNLYHSQSNCRFIYTNPDGYAAADGGSRGGYLIQATKNVFCKQEITSQNLDNIVKQIRFKTQQLVGNGTTQLVQDVDQINFDVFFDKKFKMSN